MKKLLYLILFFVLAGIVQAQSLTWEPYRNSRSVYGMYTFWKVAGQDTAAQGVYVVNIDPLIADIAALKAKADSALVLSTPRVGTPDSLNNADTTGTAGNFNFLYLDGKIAFANPTAGTDSVYVEKQSEVTGSWVSTGFGLKDEYTQLPEVRDINDRMLILIPAGKEKTYTITDGWRPGYYRVRWVTNVGKTSANRLLIKFIGIN